VSLRTRDPNGKFHSGWKDNIRIHAWVGELLDMYPSGGGTELETLLEAAGRECVRMEGKALSRASEVAEMFANKRHGVSVRDIDVNLEFQHGWRRRREILLRAAAELQNLGKAPPSR
jgi:hypothetical protein